MNKTQFNKLKKEEAKIRKRLQVIGNSTAEYAEKLAIEEANKKHAGKFYKYENSFGSDTDRWWLYFRVIKATGDHWFLAEEFQHDSHGNFKFELNNMTTKSCFQIEIDQIEYNQAIAEFWKNYHQSITE